MEQPYNYQPPRQPLFNGTVFITVFVALLAFGALMAGAFFLFNKMKNGEQAQLSNEENEAQKAINAQNILSLGLTKSKKITEPIVETAIEVLEEVVEVATTVNQEINDRWVELINNEVPDALTKKEFHREETLTTNP